MIRLLLISIWLMAILCTGGCQNSTDTEEETNNEPSTDRPSTPPVAERRGSIELIKITWVNSGGKAETVWITSDGSATLSITPSYLRQYRNGELPESQWPTLHFKLVPCGTEEMVIEQNSRSSTWAQGTTDSLEQYRSIQRISVAPLPEDQFFTLPLASDHWGLRTLLQPESWIHHLTASLPSSGQKDYRVRIQLAKQQVPFVATLYHHASPTGLKESHLTPQELSNSKPAIFSNPLYGKYSDFSSASGIAQLKLRVPQSNPPPEVQCRTQATGDIFYTRPFLVLDHQQQDNHFLLFEYPLNTYTMGEMARLSTANTHFTVLCRIATFNRLEFSFRIAFLKGEGKPN